VEADAGAAPALELCRGRSRRLSNHRNSLMGRFGGSGIGTISAWATSRERPGAAHTSAARPAALYFMHGSAIIFTRTFRRTIKMEPRLNYPKLAPEAARALHALETYLAGCGLEHSLRELVKIRASQINGCAFCLDMHTKDARAAGESEQRIYALNAWRETPFFTDRERAALAWAEAVTQIGSGVHDALFEETRKHFSEKELVDLTWAVAAINAWNRVAISFRSVPGSYQPKQPAQ
jgi:AhpD family alkylhydroperoxidase